MSTRTVEGVLGAQIRAVGMRGLMQLTDQVAVPLIAAQALVER